MDEHGFRQVMPRERDPDMPTQPFIDLKSGYVMRSIDKFPRQGLTSPWRLYQNYARDIVMLRYGSLEDDGIEFSPGGQPAEAEERLAA
jgi:hypothetical protein